MPRVYLDARNITKNPSGVARYAQSLIPRLVEQRPDWDWVVVRHDSNHDPLGVDVEEVYLDIPIDNMHNVLKGGPALTEAFASHGTPDIYHNLFHVLSRGLADDLKIVTTLHDFVWIDFAKESQGSAMAAFTIKQFAKKAIPFALQRSNHVISVSEPTKVRAQEYLKDTPCTVVTHGVEDRYFDGVPEADATVKAAAEAGYIVAVGNSKPYKNLHRVIDAFARLRKEMKGKLVLIGNCDALQPQIKKLKLSEDVILPGFVDDEGLRRWVGNASVFVFPSLVEGFGLPTLEAMALGVPCAVSEREPMNFVAGDAALKFDPENVDDIYEKLMEIMGDEATQTVLSAKGTAHAKNFTWDRSAEETLAVYDRVLS